MEKSAHWHGRKKPSFSSSLLDSIYRSIDESNGASPGPALSYTSKRQIPTIDKRLIPIPQPPANLRRHFSTSSSSDCSSFGGFSSSDADSTARPCPALNRCDRLCSDPPPEKQRQGSIRSRIRDLRILRTPASPRARLAAFLSAIFASGGRNPTKSKFPGCQEESARSCISKNPASARCGKQRSVRFSPASIAAVDDGLEKRRFGEVPMVTRDRKMVLEELLRGVDLEVEESDGESVSSSELFELESLSAIGQFRDELPVYETTNLAANRAIAHGFIV
ncbi:hypothetical protein IEQ34_017885 [Dendrobium chrysotoxum]|uniref:Uncharacterized protein n=1 Tax=Dendrobium chrysotoxum TaxID=161865 RepID=A0AAV7GBJ5_DENCH|nr:hypothetical protein IEQ34_017885 [Dendrobium chrysotoxum]